MSNEMVVKKEENRLELLVKKDTIKNRFNEVLGKKANTFISSLISATKSNKALGECEPMSVISSALQAASLDLPIDNSLGFAHIIPYGGVAQFQLGWKAFVQLAMRSGQYKTIHPSVIYDGQIKKHNSFTGEMEFQEQKNSNNAIGFLLYFKLLNGFEKFFYMTKDEVEAHAKRYSQMYKMGKGFWKTDFDSMALKTVIKLGLSKFGILSIDMQKAIKSDEGIIDAETGEVTAFPDKPQEEVAVSQPKSSRLEEALEVTATPISEVVVEEIGPKKPSQTQKWKDKFMVAANVHDLNAVLVAIPENEKSPDLDEAYRAQLKMLVGVKK
jgi:recombination protein RecT